MIKNKLYKPCKHCNGTGKIKIRATHMLTPDTKKMLALMKKNNLNQLQIAKILDISQGTVSGWFKKETNLLGKIKSIYFEMLKMKGYN